jgi:hypothetical protein
MNGVNIDCDKISFIINLQWITISILSILFIIIFYSLNNHFNTIVNFNKKTNVGKPSRQPSLPVFTEPQS